MRNKGVLYAFGAYFLWGVLPVYWKSLKEISAAQLIGHRAVWSFFLLLAFIIITSQWRKFLSLVLKPRVLVIYLLTALLIGVNWSLYVWSVNAGFIVEASLGYFINPLVSVLFGVIFLRERLRRFQRLPVVLAAIGVIYLTFTYGRLPWIALTLAFTFGLYGLVKKLAPLTSIYGLTLETGFLFPVALGYLIFQETLGQGAFLHTGFMYDLLLLGAGLVTVVPLLLFAAAARLVPLSVVGIMQYIAPTLQFLLGVFVYHELFTLSQLLGYGLVWIALLIFLLDGFFAGRKSSYK